jgi:uncharacterized membrane protein
MGARAGAALFWVVAGTMHFVIPKQYEAIVPPYVPRPRKVVYLSGVAELAGGAGVLSARTAPAAGWWLIATLVAVFPANVNMALHPERYRGIPEPLLWVRLPVQAGFVAWVFNVAIRRR